LDALRVEPGWRCLEVGAGGGSVAHLLADRIGPTGHVVAVDMNTRFLQSVDRSNIEVRRSDVRTDDLDGGYDLVHTRFVLMHLPDAMDVVAKLMRALRPGGVFLFEEGDFTGTGPIDGSSPHARGARETVDAVIRASISEGLFDPFFGRKLAADIEGASGDFASEIFRGGSASATWHRRSFDSIRPVVVGCGAVSDEVYDEVGLMLDDTNASFVGLARVGVSGRAVSSLRRASLQRV
jgi:SAM-dependent methyltransferase